MKFNIKIFLFLFFALPLASLFLGCAASDYIAKADHRTEPMLITESTIIDRDLEFDQTAFVIKGDNIILDLGGHAVTFNNGNSVEVPNSEFESWTGNTPDNWEVKSGEVKKEPSIYFGKYDLVFPFGGGVIRSRSITLKGGKTYLAFAFVKGAYTDAKVKLKILRSPDGEMLAEWENSDAVLSRGYASKGTPESDLIYTPTSDTRIMLQLECVGSSEFRVGMVDVKPAFDYGVIGYRYKNNFVAPDIKSDWFKSGTLLNVSIRNGTLIQGAGQGVRCSGIRYAEGENWKLDNVSIQLNGINTDAISMTYGKRITIEHCTITSTSLSVFNRMHGTGGIGLEHPTGDIVIRNNTIDGVPQMGISIYSCLCDGTARYAIINNTIKQRELVTEGYAITLGGGVQNFLIENNQIQPYQGRGILIDTASGCPSQADKANYNGIIQDNKILNLYEVRNPEYPENSLVCVGIRIRNWGGNTPMHKNIKISRNTIEGHTDAKGVHAIYGINITASAVDDSVEIFDNTIKVTATGKNRIASAITFQDTKLCGDSYIDIHHNTLMSNSAFLRFGGNDGPDAIGLTVWSNTFTPLYAPPPTGKPFIYGYWDSAASANTLANNDGVDPRIKDNISFEGTGKKDLTVGRHKVKVFIRDENEQPLSDVRIYLKDKDGIILTDKRTGPSGEVLFYSPETFYWVDSDQPHGTINSRNFKDGDEFMIEASKDGYDPISTRVIMDMPRMVTIWFGNEKKPISSPLSNDLSTKLKTKIRP